MSSKRLEHPPLGLPRQRAHLRPAGVHAGQVEGLAEVSIARATVVSDEVDFAEARDSLVPFGEGPDGNLSFEDRARLRPVAALYSQTLPVWAQCPVDGRSRDPKKLASDLRLELDLPVALQSLDDLSHERSQPVAGRTVQGGSHVPKGVDDVFAVRPWPWSPWWSGAVVQRLSRRPPGVTPGPAGELTQLVEQPPFLRLRALTVRRGHLLGHRSSLCHGKPHRTRSSVRPPAPGEGRLWRTYLGEARPGFRGHLWGVNSPPGGAGRAPARLT